ncbi:hypothetical protein D9758_011558 [Tetrapyrgos nigripes]|uniref:Rad4-domain-containing protein n=1 Tax=Tetrapyrgos nigripes TaxID=182062 RepID=A0A8H5CNV2_9AGAR|nr:hypothetical protein D9758_011558 [Tetrapyrgos nigripes]
MSTIDDPVLEPLPDADSDDELDWEEVPVPEEQKHLEIVIQARPKEKETPSAKKGISHAERLLRIDVHKVHTVTLLLNAKIRNRWLNDELLHARLLSLTPLSLQNSLAMIHPSRVPEQAKRGRMFETAVGHLVEWWSQEFFEVIPEGHIQNRTFDSIQKGLISHGFGPDTPEDKLIDDETLEDILDEDAEIIRSSKSLMKHALMQRGSRDLCARGLSIPARLVVSLQSVPWQASVGKPKPKYVKKDKGKAAAKGDMSEEQSEMLEDSGAVASSSKSTIDNASEFKGEGQRLDGAPVEKSEKAKGKEKAKPPIKLRKTKSKGNVLGSKPAPPKVRYIDPRISPPVFWTEVFSRPDSRWIPVDPIRGIVNKSKVFDPSDTPSGVHVDNRMMYVLAFEEDGYARDVTRRYAKQYGAKVAKAQGGSLAPGAGGKGRAQWWQRVVGAVTRPFRLNRDDLEDAEFEQAQWNEGMPTTIGGFKDHPLYVLPRHLKQNETLYPSPPATPELGKFRGEPVYSRSAVVLLKTAENWLRSEGRSVKEGAQPLKLIKMRASTVGRRRELKMLKEGLRVAGESGSGGGDAGAGAAGASKQQAEVMQGLYARHQTELFVPPPVIDGIVPKNNFGNIDLYVPSMLPRGAVHIPFKGVAKIARKLGLDFGEAVTGFEFRKRIATPIMEGIVIASEHETVVLEAFWEAEQESERKARAKREERVIKQWTRLIHGLRIRQRLQAQYASNTTNDKAAETTPQGMDVDRESHQHHDEDESHMHLTGEGGFLLRGADDVVQSYSLPKAQHFTPHFDIAGPSGSGLTSTLTLTSMMSNLDKGYDTNGESKRKDVRSGPNARGGASEDLDSGHDRMAFAMETMDVDDDDDVHMHLNPTSLSLRHGHSLPSAAESTSAEFVPKTMEELAEEAVRANGPGGHAEDGEVEEIDIVPTSTLVGKENGAGGGASSGIGRSTRRGAARATVIHQVNDHDESTAEPAVNGNTKRTTRNASVRGTSRGRGRGQGRGKGAAAGRGRKPKKSTRKRKRDEEEDKEDEAVSDDDDDAEMDDHIHLEADDDEGDGGGDDGKDKGPAVKRKSSTSPAKRTRANKTKTTTSTVPVPVPIPTSTRTLRPRASKTEAQLRGEKEMEEAYRRAIAQ